MKNFIILINMSTFLFLNNCTKTDIQTILCNATDDVDIIECSKIKVLDKLE